MKSIPIPFNLWTILPIPNRPPEVGAQQLKVRFLFLAPDDSVKFLKKS